MNVVSRSVRKALLVTSALACVVFMVVPAWGVDKTSSGAASSSPAERGESVFQQKCASCHTVGGGRLVGPDLQGVATRRERKWLERFIAAPDKVLAEGDPVATKLFEEFRIPMPNLGLSNEEVKALVAFLESPAEAAHHAAEAPAPAAPEVKPAPAGDPVAGKKLFTGTVAFRGGGAPCLACHSIAGLASLGGGRLGPDLTGAFANYGDAGIASVLETIPFPTMQPIYGPHPLAPGERANLKAFIEEAGGRQPTSAGVGYSLLASVVFLGLFVLPHVVWRKRLQGVRKSLLKDS